MGKAATKDFAWVRRIGWGWVIRSVPLVEWVHVPLLFLILPWSLSPKSWFSGLMVVTMAAFVLAIGFSTLHWWLFYHLIKCPACGTNPTQDRWTQRRMRYAEAMARLEACGCCPACGAER